MSTAPTYDRVGECLKCHRFKKLRTQHSFITKRPAGYCEDCLEGRPVVCPGSGLAWKVERRQGSCPTCARQWPGLDRRKAEYKTVPMHMLTGAS